MARPGDIPGMQPEDYAPGHLGDAYGSMTSGAYGQQRAFSDAGGSLAGMQTAGGLSALPGMAGSAFMMSAMAAPMIMGGAQSGTMLRAGASGFSAVPGMAAGARAAMGAGRSGVGGALGALGRQGLYGVGYAAQTVDPFTAAFAMGGGAARATWATASRALGVHARSRAAGGLFTAIGRQFANRGVQAGVGMLARVGVAGGASAASGLMAAAPPLAAAAAAAAALSKVGTSMYQGATDSAHGQALVNDLGSHIAPGANMRGQGRETGKMMRDVAQSLGTGVEDISRYAQQLDSMKVFQTTRSAQEFRDKFKKVMSAVKEISKITQSSVDDAMQMFGELKQQGFYTTSDMKSQAAAKHAREVTTGISSGIMSAVGHAGSRAARAYGMRGRYGAELAQREVAGVSRGLRSGAMSEEAINEMGGVEAVGMRLAQKQMGFLGSSRGRAMIAYSMGAGGAPDQDRLMRMLGGDTSIEDIVTGAAGRGLGVLRKAGSREAKQEFAKYAGMSMVKMAAAQQKQLYGSTSEKGILRMLGTMGMNRDEAKIALQQTMQMPEQLRAEQLAKETAAEQAAYTARANAGKYSTRISKTLERTLGRGSRAIGGAVSEAVSSTYTNAMESLRGEREYETGSDQDLARRFRLRGGDERMLGIQESWRPFGQDRASDRMRQQYSHLLASDASGLGMSQEELSAGLKSGEIVDVGRDISSRIGGGGRYARRSDIQKDDAAYSRGIKRGASTQEFKGLRRSLTRGDYNTRRIKSSASSLGLLGATGAAAWLEKLTGGSNIEDLQKSHTAWFAAKESGIIGEDVTLKDFQGMSGERRTEVMGQVTSALRKASEGGDSAASRSLEILGSREEGLLQGKDLQGRRDDFEEKISKSLGGSFGKGLSAKGILAGAAGGPLGMIMGALSGNKQAALGKELSRNSESRANYEGLMRNLLGGDKINKDNVQTYLDALKKSAGGEDSEAYKLAQQQVRRIQDDEGFRKQQQKEWSRKGGTRDLLGAMASAELSDRDAQGLRGRMSKYKGGKYSDSGLSDRLQALKNASEGGDYALMRSRGRDLVGSIVRSTSQDGGIISDEERNALDSFGGAGAGSRLARMVSGMQGKDKSMRKQLGELTDDAGNKVFTQEEFKRIEGLSGNEQSAAIADALEKAGLTDLGSLADRSGKKTSTEGLQTAQVEANTRFVNAVSAFVTALSAAGVEGVPTNISVEVGDAAGAVGEA